MLFNVFIYKEEHFILIYTVRIGELIVNLSKITEVDGRPNMLKKSHSDVIPNHIGLSNERDKLSFNKLWHDILLFTKIFTH